MPVSGNKQTEKKLKYHFFFSHAINFSRIDKKWDEYAACCTTLLWNIIWMKLFKLMHKHLQSQATVT